MKIGRIVKDLTDGSRKENLKSGIGNRRIAISIFYPVDRQFKPQNQAMYTDLFHPAIERSIEILKEGGADENHITKLEINAYNDAPISNTDKKYPVIIYSPGYGVNRDYYMFNINSLVLEGYIVISIGHTYDSELTIFPNGEIIQQTDEEFDTDDLFNKCIGDTRKNDIGFVLNEIERMNKEDVTFKGRLDIEKIGGIGHSYGGLTLLESSKDKRIKCVVMLDGSIHRLTLKDRISIPVLSIRQEASSYELIKKIYPEDIAKQLSGNQKKLYEIIDNYKSFIKINKASHMSFCEEPLIFNNENLEELKKIHQSINEATNHFFNEFLLGRESEYKDFLSDKQNESIYILNADGEVQDSIIDRNIH